jgi:ABC-2 type transport system permease protein
LFIALVFAQIPDLNGWSLDEMIFLYGYFQLPRGLDHLLTDNIWLIPSRVRRGDIDRYLLRPINPLFQVIVERFQIEAFGELAIGILLVGYAIPRLAIVWTPLSVLLALVFILLGSLIYTSIKLITASIGFWVINSMPIMTTVYNIADFSKYPATALMNKADSIGILLGSVLAVSLLSFLAYRLWLKGLASYQSVGS